MTGRDYYREALKAFQNLSPLERLEARLAYLELVDICRKEDPKVLKSAYEQSIRMFA